MWGCSHCPKTFQYNSERKRHELSHMPRFQCENCSKKFSFLSALRRHQKQHERTGTAKCEECGKKFRDDVLLKRHVKYAHKGTFICEKCTHPFSSELALRTHLKTHKPESERRFKCSFHDCTKSFNFSHHLKHHELTHTNSKQYYCSFCGKGFIQSHHLKAHLKSHDPSERLYCEVDGCNKKFSSHYARKRHMATHKNKPDSGISSDSNSCDAATPSKTCTEESFLCSTCGETISQNEYQIHALKCAGNQENDTSAEEWPNSPFKPESAKDSCSPNSNIEKDIGDCNMLLGCCIVKNEDCICEQMAKPVSENYDFTPIGSNDNEEVNLADNLQYNKNSNSKVGNPTLTIVKVGTEVDCTNVDMCEGCDCSSTCNRKIPNIDLTPKIKKDSTTPNIEYRIDGVIKIMDTFDDDIVVKKESNDKADSFIPFSSCKDVIGNCLVSGGDGCLCARMMASEDQAILAQEIEDITPRPKSEIV